MDSRQCAIYETRPDICRVDRQYGLNYSQEMTWDEFVGANLRACAWLAKMSTQTALENAP